jgi:hypothetical protein
MTFEVTGMGQRRLGRALGLGLVCLAGIASCAGGSEAELRSPDDALAASIGASPGSGGGSAVAVPLGEAAQAPLDEAAREANWLELGVPGVSNRPALASSPSGWLALSRRSVGDARAPSGWESYLYRSNDGVRWQKVEVSDHNDNLWLRGVAYGAGRYVLAGHRFGESGGGVIFSSDDGSSWVEAAVALPDAEQLAGAVYAGGRFFALGTLKSLLTSVDGAEWAALDLHEQTLQPHDVAFGGGRYLVVGSGNPQFSLDGISWQSAPLECALPGACVETPSGQFAPGYQTHAVYADGRYFIDQATSTDAETWHALPGLFPEAAVDGEVLGSSDAEPLLLWSPGETPEPLRNTRYIDSLSGTERTLRMRWNGAVKPGEVSADNFPNEEAPPDDLEFPLASGLDCATSRCLIVGERLFLISP